MEPIIEDVVLPIVNNVSNINLFFIEHLLFLCDI